jgi:heptosyltransferase I
LICIFSIRIQTINISSVKILIIKLSSIGDIVHALPAFAKIRREFPDSEIGWAVDSRFAELLRENPMIDHLVEIDRRSIRGDNVINETKRGISTQLSALRNHRFDVVLDLQGLLKSAAVAKLSGAKKRWGFARRDLREPASRVFYTDTYSAKPQINMVEKNIGLAAHAFGFQPNLETLEFPIFPNHVDRSEAEAVAEKAGGRFVLLNPGSVWVTKRWPAENYGKLADKIYEELGHSSVISIGPNDQDLLEAAISSSKSGKLISTTLSLKGFYHLASLAEIYVGGDTGPTHIAVAAGTPVVGIYGPTEWWRNGSINPADICVVRDDIGCRVDCYRRTCSNWICMEISVDTVFQAVIDRLER